MSAYFPDSEVSAYHEKKQPVRRSVRAAVKLASGALSLVCASVAAGVWVEQAQGERPTVVRLSDDTEQCQGSNFFVAYMSGTGLETAQYAARENQSLAKTYGACSLVVEYGTNFYSEAIAQQLIERVEEHLDDGELGHVLLVGNSFGGIAAQRVADSPSLYGSKRVQVNGMLLQATPANAECVKGVGQNLVRLSPSQLVVGKTPVLLMNLWGIVERQDNVFDTGALQDAFHNTAVTSSSLIATQATMIREGFPEPRPLPQDGTTGESIQRTYWYQYIESDKVQDPECSKRGINIRLRTIGKEAVSLVVKPFSAPGNLQHASDWLRPDNLGYRESNERVFAGMRAQFAPAYSVMRQSGSMRRTV